MAENQTQEKQEEKFSMENLYLYLKKRYGVIETEVFNSREHELKRINLNIPEIPDMPEIEKINPKKDLVLILREDKGDIEICIREECTQENIPWTVLMYIRGGFVYINQTYSGISEEFIQEYHKRLFLLILLKDFNKDVVCSSVK
jgi:hypothetical protein